MHIWIWCLNLIRQSQNKLKLNESNKPFIEFGSFCTFVCNLTCQVPDFVGLNFIFRIVTKLITEYYFISTLMMKIMTFFNNQYWCLTIQFYFCYIHICLANWYFSIFVLVLLYIHMNMQISIFLTEILKIFIILSKCFKLAQGVAMWAYKM